MSTSPLASAPSVPFSLPPSSVREAGGLGAGLVGTGARGPAAAEATGPGRETWAPFDWVGFVPFVLCHLAVLGALWSGVTWTAVAVGIGLYWARMFGVTAGYHRLFAHKSYETSRPFAFAMAFLAQSTIQKGALWWASHHRAHHLYSDTPRDAHSPAQQGFLESHLGWIFHTGDSPDWKRVQDWARFPELVWLDRYYLVPPVVLGFTVWALFGWSGLFVGFFASTVCTWHGTFVINSLAHVWGSRRYPTRDDSRNNLWLALITMGEGWHNNHHHHMGSARQGFFPGEIDLSYGILCGLEKLGLVWDLKQPPARVLEEGRALDAARSV